MVYELCYIIFGTMFCNEIMLFYINGITLHYVMLTIYVV